jgi:TRAP transporter 4TM/12TM fusion protein
VIDGAAPSKFRLLTGPARRLERVLLSALTLLGGFWATGAHHRLPWTFFNEQFLGLFLGLGLAATFVCVKRHSQETGVGVPWLDRILALAGFAAGAYVTVRYPVIAYELGILTWDKVLFGALAIVLALEATRRLAGWALVGLAGIVILYVRFADWLPGELAGKAATWPRIAVYLYLDTNALFGLPIAVTASIVVAFILFGQMLTLVGGDRFLSDFALAVMGRYRGGPAKVAVVASSLFGTVSGNAVSNVIVDGPITIPMMKRAGYPAHVAAAIEAVASTGGQIMPPVMGVAAFLIAEVLAIPYGDVALAAAIPAVLYYLALFVQVDLEAAKRGLAGRPASELPHVRDALSRGWSFLVPLGVIVYGLMIASWDAGAAGMVAALTTIVVAAIERAVRAQAWWVPGIAGGIEATGRLVLDLVAITAVAGLVVGALQLSGFAFRLSLLLVSAAAASALVLLLLTAAVCIVLGMGMPTAVIYIMLAVLVGPALVELGIAPLGAHLFLFYFGMLSMITPPVCLATFAAASIGQADFLKAGWAGMRLGIVAYVVPFIFAFHPALLMQDTPGTVVLAFVTAAAGVALLGVACAGHLSRPLSWPKRAWVGVAGLALLPPASSAVWLATNAAGVVLGLAFLATERRSPKPELQNAGSVTPRP